MKERNEDEFIDDLVMRDLMGDDVGFDDDDIEFLKTHPEVLEKLSDPTLFKRRYAYIVLAVALAMMSVSKIFQYSRALADHEILNDIFTGILFSVSSDLLGATILIFLLDLLFERRIQRNREMIDRLSRESRTSPKKKRL